MTVEQPDLRKARILIVEDEPFIALDILHAVELAGGEPVGPATSVRQALLLIEEDGVQGAILDVNLPDGHIGPVLAALDVTVPVLVHTGVGLPSELAGRFPNVSVYLKPTPAAVLAGKLAIAICGERRLPPVS